MYTWENPRPPYPNELYHHGILGMHWGIRRYQPYRKGEHVKGGHFIGQAIAKNRTTADSYHSSYLAADYQRKADKLNEEAKRRKSKWEKSMEKGSSDAKQYRKEKRYLRSKALADDNQARAAFWKKQAKQDIATAQKVNDQFAIDHPHTIRKAPASSVESGAARYQFEKSYAAYKDGDKTYSVVKPNTPLWNWDRPLWGHQRAVEKAKGFDYRENRREYKNVTKKNLKDTRKLNKALDKGDKETANALKKQMHNRENEYRTEYSEKMRKKYNRQEDNRNRMNKVHDIDSRIPKALNNTNYQKMPEQKARKTAANQLRSIGVKPNVAEQVVRNMDVDTIADMMKDYKEFKRRGINMSNWSAKDVRDTLVG